MGSVITGVIVSIVVMSIAWFGDTTGAELYGLPFMLALALGVFVIQWIGLIHARTFETEKFYDLVGSISYIGVTVFVVSTVESVGVRQQIIAVAVIVWALRLGPFLFRRVLAVGEDQRFRHIKKSTPRFFLAWTLQGTWVFITASAALAAIVAPNTNPLEPLFYVGAALWIIGMTIEVIADEQKNAFRKNPDNAGKFITTGLWARSQHPNYFGEIMLWTGVAVMALPSLQGSALIFLLSPALVTLLLTRVSGIPTLRKAGEKRWGDDPAYRAYRENTSVLIPKLF